ncbi:MAG: 3-methyl-2-oxobutanoate dehydrogenase subunit VorB [Firmicutes bacterium]|nr:3-methyl-2-oxobutanoate dehydrogenase subunit VorB [Bacillota bacterium]
MARMLMQGNEAIGKAAIIAGCKAFFGYPITPQNELPAYMAEHLPKAGGVFLQAESELAAINMVYGAAGAGARVMTSSSSPGISLKQEGISYLAGAELPCVIANVMRCGPGLGGILPAQADYFQAVKGGGHGDYRLLVLAPASVQEMADLTVLAFELADEYRNPVMLLTDGMIGQIMEPVEFQRLESQASIPQKPWATTGALGRPRNVINSLYIDPQVLEDRNRRLQSKYAQMKAKEVRYAEYRAEDAELLLVAYGSMARVARSVVDWGRAQGWPLGLLRPITLFPFPEEALLQRAQQVSSLLVLEMSAGQMVEDVRLAVKESCPVRFYGRMGGVIPTSREIIGQVESVLSGLKGGAPDVSNL